MTPFPLHKELSHSRFPMNRVPAGPYKQNGVAWGVTMRGIIKSGRRWGAALFAASLVCSAASGAPQHDGLIGNSAATPFAVRSLLLGSLRRENLTGLFGPFPPSLESGTGIHVSGIVSHAFFRPYRVTFDFTRMTPSLRKSGP
jgi:hypothetical protein